jgi:uncharacterized protein (TIGR02147 family)
MEIEKPIGERGRIPTLTSFTDYRLFLRAIFEARKKSNSRFSFRGFSTLVGFKSPNYLQLILDGQRNLTSETAGEIATRLKLSAHERTYFIALVKLASAKTETEKVEAERARLVALKKIVSRDIPAAKKEIFTRWYHLLVRELFLLKGARADAQWIVDRLGGCVSLEEASRSIELLCKSGFLEPTVGSYRLTEPVLDTDDSQMQAAFMRKFHSETLRVWSQKLNELPLAQQELGVLNIPIDSRKIPELRRRIRQFQDEIIGWVQD